MGFHPPTEVQKAFFQRLVQAAEPQLAKVLQSQIDGAETSNDECPECLHVAVVNSSALRLQGFGYPIEFEAADPTSDIPAVQVFLWPSNGLLHWIEISWVGEDHPELRNLEIYPRAYREDSA